MTTIAQCAASMLHTTVAGEPERPTDWFELSVGNGPFTERERAGLTFDEHGQITMYWTLDDNGTPDRSGPAVSLIDTATTETGHILVQVAGTDAAGDDISGCHVWTSDGQFVDVYR